jgi:hypothetical protein
MKSDMYFYFYFFKFYIAINAGVSNNVLVHSSFIIDFKLPLFLQQLSLI